MRQLLGAWRAPGRVDAAADRALLDLDVQVAGARDALLTYRADERRLADLTTDAQTRADRATARAAAALRQGHEDAAREAAWTALTARGLAERYAQQWRTRRVEAARMSAALDALEARLTLAAQETQALRARRQLAEARRSLGAALTTGPLALRRDCAEDAVRTDEAVAGALARLSDDDMDEIPAADTVEAFLLALRRDALPPGRREDA